MAIVEGGRILLQNHPRWTEVKRAWHARMRFQSLQSSGMDGSIWLSRGPLRSG